ncbi:MAG: hypothetical protein ABI296_00220 [Gammaproteobacteria bacterium]
MLYRVTKQYGRGTETPVAEFNDLEEAKLFINGKLLEDERVKVKATYRLFEGMDLVNEFSESWLKSSSSDDEGSASGATGAGRSSGFQPTPFNTAPRPTGLPHNWVKDEDGKKEDDQ